MRRFYVAYAALAVVIAGIGIATGAAVASETHTKVVTKVKTKAATYSGPASLLAFLGGTPQQVQCPDSIQGATCVQWSGNDYFVFAAFPAGQ